MTAIVDIAIVVGIAAIYTTFVPLIDIISYESYAHDFILVIVHFQYIDQGQMRHTH